MTETYGLFALKRVWLRSMRTKRGIFLFGATLSLLIMTLTSTHIGTKRLFIDFILTTSIRIVESNARKISLQTFYDAQFTFSAQLIVLNYLVILSHPRSTAVLFRNLPPSNNTVANQYGPMRKTPSNNLNNNRIEMHQ